MESKKSESFMFPVSVSLTNDDCNKKLRVCAHFFWSTRINSRFVCTCVCGLQDATKTSLPSRKPRDMTMAAAVQTISAVAYTRNRACECMLLFSRASLAFKLEDVWRWQPQTFPIIKANEILNRAPVKSTLHKPPSFRLRVDETGISE